jgi:hypothetical protein
MTNENCRFATKYCFEKGLCPSQMSRFNVHSVYATSNMGTGHFSSSAKDCSLSEQTSIDLATLDPNECKTLTTLGVGRTQIRDFERISHSTMSPKTLDSMEYRTRPHLDLVAGVDVPVVLGHCVDAADALEARRVKKPVLEDAEVLSPQLHAERVHLRLGVADGMKKEVRHDAHLGPLAVEQQFAAPSGVYKTHLALGELPPRGPHGVHRLVRPNGRLRVPVGQNEVVEKKAREKKTIPAVLILFGLPGDQWCKYVFFYSPNQSFSRHSA